MLLFNYLSRNSTVQGQVFLYLLVHVVVVVVSLGIAANLRENELKVVLFSFLFYCQNFFNELPSVLGCLTGAD